jgi:hypothetical protein
VEAIVGVGDTAEGEATGAGVSTASDGGAVAEDDGQEDGEPDDGEPEDGAPEVQPAATMSDIAVAPRRR